MSKLEEVPFLSQNYPCRPKRHKKIWCDCPFNKLYNGGCPVSAREAEKRKDQPIDDSAVVDDMFGFLEVRTAES